LAKVPENPKKDNFQIEILQEKFIIGMKE